MPYLLSSDTAEWIRRQKAAGGDMRARPRRARPSDAALARQGQWRVTAARGDGDSWKVSCGPGMLAWGGGHNVSWPVGGNGAPDLAASEEIGEMAAGAKWVVWSTKSPPCPTAHDTRWPLGDGPTAHATGSVGGEEVSLESDITELEGDPDGFSADAGEVTLEEPGFERPDGVTDWRLLAVVEVAQSAAKVTQIHSETIEVHAIVRPGEEDDTEESGDEDAEDAPPCGNPLNDGDGEGGGGRKDNPLDGPAPSGGGDGRGPTDNPLDHEGDGGFTPNCKEEE